MKIWSKYIYTILQLTVAGLFAAYFIFFSDWAMNMMDPDTVVGMILIFGCVVMMWFGNILRIVMLNDEIKKLRSERNVQE